LVPAVVLAWLGYRQLRYEAFYLHQSMAVELTGRIDRRAAELFTAENEKSFVDFGFLIIGDGNFVQRSPLSAYPVTGQIPGLVSYFQVDSEGEFSTPLLPGKVAQDDGSSKGELSADEFAGRLALEDRARSLLAGSLSEDKKMEEKKRTDASPAIDEIVVEEQEAEPPARLYRQQVELAEGQKVFDRFNAPKAKADSALGNVRELRLKETYEHLASSNEAAVSVGLSSEVRSPAMPSAAPVALDPSADSPAEKDSLSGLNDQVRRDADVSAGFEEVGRRLEKSVALSEAPPGDRVADLEQLPLTIFESEVDPFRFDLLDEDHFVLYRNVWRDQQRFVQGAIIEREVFIEGLIGSLFRGTSLAGVASLIVAHRGEVLHTYLGRSSTGYASRASDITGTLLYQTRLTMPVNDIELIFGFDQLPTGPGGTLIGWTTLVFLALLMGGFALLYRLGVKQIALGEQQQDFVSAVSHELKTPLTSIRMYGEILKAGWASEEKKRGYYEFIFDESERLTRLINNVLRLARFDRNGSDLDLEPITVSELVDLARSKIASQIAQAGFELVEDHQKLDLEVEADSDAFVQIVINLVDNALKFSNGSDQKKVVFSSRLRDPAWVEFSVRDYGPGIPKDQMKKIFRLFYRTERELTRETVGTGIGLALVHELVTAMGGSVDVRNAEPGAEFLVRLPLQQS